MVTKSSSRASAPAPPASAPHADKPINVLILGETANGKSTLIKRLSTYSGNKTPDVLIGNGNESCTKIVASHPVSARLHSYSLIDTLGQPVKCSTYDDLLDMTWEDAGQAQSIPDEGGKTFKFDFFDTPGLDDSGGNDVAIMADIIRNITTLPHLNAIIYVRSMELPFGRAFRTWYDYLERCMPMLCRGMIVVHSRCTAERIADAMSRGLNLTDDRRKAFEAATGGHNRNAHFFMDNDPDTYSPFSVVQSLNGCYQLLKLLSKQRPLDVSNVRLFKSPDMNRLDGQAALVLGRVQDGIKEELARKMADASKSKQALELAKRGVNLFRRKLDHCDAELARLDNNHEVLLGTKSVQDDYSIIQDLLLCYRLQLPKREASFHAACDIRHVVTSTEPGSQWVDEERSHRRWSAKLKAGLFSSMAGSATFYSTNRIMHSQKIEKLKQEQIDLASDLAGHESTVKSESGKGVKLDGDVEELAAGLDKVESMKETLEQKTFDVALWPELRRLYTSTDSVGTNEVIELVSVYDPSTALLIKRRL